MDESKTPETMLTGDSLPVLEWLGDQMPGGFFIYRADGSQDLLYVNRAMLGMFGCGSLQEFKELTGYTFKGMVHPDDLDGVLASIEEQIAGGAGDNLDYVEYRIIRKDGFIRWVDDYGYRAQLSGYGDVFYVFITDATDKRLMEQEKRANEMKSAFLFNISHDIRTPMNAIMGFSDLAKRHIHDIDQLEDYLDKISDSSHQLMVLIDDMLEMSRIDCGRVEIKAQPANLREQLGLVADLFRDRCREKQVAFVEDIDVPEGEVLVDEHCLRRVLSNLVDNAVKFTPSGGTVTLAARQKQVSDSGYARFEFVVADTGIGMSEEFMARMYQAFEREETSTKAGTVGTGLGLSITKSLLDVMGGSISVTSKRGEGSTFTVDLPLKLAGSAPSPDSAAEPEAEQRAEGAFRILLVEDIEINRMLAEAVLEEAGFQVESVPDGCDAVDAVKGHSPYYYDLVLMDIQMPVMNGYEATRAIRALGRQDTADLPIIALSANAREEDKRMSRESGMDNHVAKPFDVAHLIKTVNVYIAARNSAGAAARREADGGRG